MVHSPQVVCHFMYVKEYVLHMHINIRMMFCIGPRATLIKILFGVKFQEGNIFSIQPVLTNSNFKFQTKSSEYMKPKNLRHEMQL